MVHSDEVSPRPVCHDDPAVSNGLSPAKIRVCLTLKRSSKNRGVGDSVNTVYYRISEDRISQETQLEISAGKIVSEVLL